MTAQGNSYAFKASTGKHSFQRSSFTSRSFPTHYKPYRLDFLPEKQKLIGENIILNTGRTWSVFSGQNSTALCRAAGQICVRGVEKFLQRSPECFKPKRASKSKNLELKYKNMYVKKREFGHSQAGCFSGSSSR